MNKGSSDFLSIKYVLDSEKRLNTFSSERNFESSGSQNNGTQNLI